jgi:hypothetical protein
VRLRLVSRIQNSAKSLEDFFEPFKPSSTTSLISTKLFDIMAQTQDISVARAVFVSTLLRSDRAAPEISRDDATLFAKTVLKTCNVCTTSNIKVFGR